MHAGPSPPATGRTRRPSERNTHYLRPEDTIYSLALAYGTSAKRLLAFNRMTDRALLHSRASIDVPPECPRPSISATRPGDEAARQRTAKLLRLMQTHKVRREVAEVYLDQAGGDLARALEKWEADERWERAHPMGRREGAQGGGMRAGSVEMNPSRMAKLLR